MLTRLLATMALSVLLALPSEAAETRLSGLALASDGRPLQGVVAIETGRLYSKDYRYGGPIEADGRFSVRLPEGGDYGLHIYATGYVYHPVGLEVKEGKDNRFHFKVPPNPAVEEAPVISNVQYAPGKNEAGTMDISLRVNDPNDNLSHQVLAINVVTGEAHSFKPPRFVFPWTRNYPNGKYSLTLRVSGRSFAPQEWRFLAADNRCYNSPILKHPFTLKSGVVPAHPKGQPAATSPVAKAAEEHIELGVEAGRKVFEENCIICHYADRAETKVGPGLKGLFAREFTPVERIPVTEENIRKRIENGGANMPPYSHIGEPNRSALILYLRSL